MGNPLLDISSEVPLSFVEKHGLKMNNAILAGAELAPFFDELVKSFPVEYVAGGATQNTARVFKWMSQGRANVSYCGCIGKDEFGRQLDKQARQDGVDVQYLISETEPTGSCGVLVNNAERSLVARLGAAEKYSVSHLESAAIQALVQKASHFYISGFFMTHSHDSILKVAQHAAAADKVMCMNTSATFLWEVRDCIASPYTFCNTFTRYRFCLACSSN
jgi:adenosine kinase